MATQSSIPGGGTRLYQVHALTLLANFLVSSSFPIGHAITHGFEPGVLMLIRFVMAAAMMGLFVGFRYGITWPGWRSLARYGVLAVMPVGFFWCMFEALRFTSPLNTSALFTTVPGISAIVAAIFIGERLGWHRLVVLGIGMVGALWVVFRGEPARVAAFDLNYGDVMFLVGCLFFGVYGVLIKHLHRGEPTAIMTFWVLVIAAVLYLAIAAKDLAAADWMGAGIGVYGGAAYLALVTTVITFFIFQYATPRIGPTRVQAYSYFIPGFVLLTEWVLGRGLPLMTLPGIALVLVASYVVQRGSTLQDTA